MNRVLQVGTVIALGALALVGTGCPDNEDPCGEPIYAEGSTDEAWLSINDAKDRVKTDDTRGAKVTSPTEGQEISAEGAALTITWTSPLTTSLEPARRVHRRASFADRLLDVVYPAAWAHEPPVTGAMHLLEISTANQQCPVRVLTGKTEWQVDDGTWTWLKSHKGEPIRIEVTSAYLTENRITEGPYRASSPRTFTVK